MLAPRMELHLYARVHCEAVGRRIRTGRLALTSVNGGKLQSPYKHDTG